ncbi:chromate efflux transporter [Sphingomonas soli]|uniref:chromate efflux transporter n=1 Tax=Sphingomonas soli TaxID=266127 RepID=UPI00082A5AA1|nr:chromate efflux transporter [Sphingomonas soli]
METESPNGPPVLSLWTLFLKFLRFGCLAFGGPVAQIAMIRQALVDEEKWVTPARFNRLLAVMQILPGPEAHELCVHFGMIARGRIGGLLAGLGFMLPGLALMLACAAAYTRFIAGQSGFDGILLGIQIFVIAIIVGAVRRIARHALPNIFLIVLALAGAAGTLAGIPFWVLLAAGGAAYALLARPVIAAAAVGACAAIGYLAQSGTPAHIAAQPAGDVQLILLFLAGLKGGLLTFGGAYTAIPYVRADTVGRGWLSDGAFLDGVALAGMLPTPLVIFGTFAGYLAGGLPGALAVTTGMFLPAFAFSLLFFERLEWVIDNPSLHRLLDGVAAVVVGIIAATCIDLGVALAARTEQMFLATLLFAVALAIALGWKNQYAAPALVLSGGVAGWLAFG